MGRKGVRRTRSRVSRGVILRRRRSKGRPPEPRGWANSAGREARPSGPFLRDARAPPPRPASATKSRPCSRSPRGAPRRTSGQAGRPRAAPSRSQWGVQAASLRSSLTARQRARPATARDGQPIFVDSLSTRPSRHGARGGAQGGGALPPVVPALLSSSQNRSKFDLI